MIKIGFGNIGVQTHIQTLAKKEKQNLTHTYFDNILLKKIKPKNREEAVEIMNNLRNRYKGYSFEFGNDRKQTYVRAFSLDEPKIYVATPKWYIGTMRFLRGLDSTFAELFRKERMNAYEAQKEKEFIGKMRNS